MNIKPEIVEEGGVMPEETPRETAVLEHVKSCRITADDYRKRFKTKWDEVQSQVAQQHPSEWDKKAAWQTKVYIGLQSKKSETAAAYLHKMIFGNRRFYAVEGVEQNDKKISDSIMEYMDNSFERGGFEYQNGFVLQESVDIGTGFIKAVVNKDRTGLDFFWRSPYNVTFDPACGNDFYAKKYLLDEYTKPIAELVDEARSGRGIYSWEKVESMLKDMQDSQVDSNKSTEALLSVKGINNTSFIIPKEYATLNLIEFWGLVPRETEQEADGLKKKVVEYDQRVITIVNEKYLLRDDENPYGLTPYFICPTKQRLYDAYGKGFCFNSTDIQSLMNSMVNLGFDSLKMCSMDIAMINADKVKDPASIVYAPMAVWKFKDNPNQCVALTRQGISALRDILQGVTMLDQFDQETSGVLRQVQGAPQMSGGKETLGEYEAKLAMIDNRFLYVARQIERAYVEPLIKGVFKMLFNPKIFSQETVDRVLGTDTKPVVNPITGQAVPMPVPKIDFNSIATAGEMGFDFKATGMTQYTSKMENTQRLEKILQAVLLSPDLKMLTKVDKLWEKALQASEMPDYQDILKTDEEVMAGMNIVGGGLEMPSEAGPAGMPPEMGQPPAGPQGPDMGGNVPPEIIAALASQGMQPQGGAV